jgi:multiple sugar transport system permease protein
MTVTTTHDARPATSADTPTTTPARTGSRPGRASRALRLAALVTGAVAFLFPFWYMVVGSLQAETDPEPSGAVPRPGNLTLDNYTAINGAVSLGRALVNSGVFTGGVLLATAVLGVLTGYALAVLQFRGRGLVFAAVLLVQIVPFHLLMIPLYVLIVRAYGLADTYLGMVLPFAVNATAVFLFRQFFLSVPRELFEAARIDGAGELTVLWRVALPLCRPALVTALLVTFIGPWNEFLWPFLVTKEADMQPLAVALAGYIADAARGTADNPVGAILAGACVLAAPAVVLFTVFQRHFTSTDLGSSLKG